jgi:predicted MFS family arabinose efflux permease
MTTIKHMGHKYQLLIIPLTLWNGFEQAFISADFTKSFVTCTRGPEFVGWTMICYGVCDTLGSYLFGFMVKHVGRAACFIAAACMNYAMIFTFLFWTRTVDEVYLLFLLPAIWGLGDAVWQTQINGNLHD